MFVVIVVSTLITVLVIIITTICYLITVLSDESDDDVDTLPIAHNFSSSPAVSPNPINLPNNDQQHQHCLTLNHCHCNDAATSTSEEDSPPPLENDEKSASPEQDTINKQASDDGPSFNINLAPKVAPKAIVSPPLQSSSWNTSTSAQKSMIINQIGNLTSKQIFDDFDNKEMQLGGTGLHWSKSRKSLDKLIQIGVPIDLPNKQREAALHVAIRKKRLQVLIGLLCYDADVDVRNEHGETPLILATRMNDILACQLLIVFDSEVDAVDNSGLSARHYAAGICDKSKSHQQPPSAAHLILSMLDSIGASRCKESHNLASNASQISSNTSKRRLSSFATCTDGCSPTGTYNGNQYNRWPDFHKESLYRRCMSLDIIKDFRCEKLSRVQNQINGMPNTSRLLCIDGGGMRGVLVCQIMIEMEKYLKKPVIEYFDWIGGTSAGAFIASALCTGSSLRDLRRFCFDVKDEVFNGSKPYNHKILEKLFKTTLGATTRMSDIKGKKLAITTVVADREPCQLRIFRNYPDQTGLLERYGLSPEVYNSMSSHSLVVRKEPIVSKSLKSSTSVLKSVKSSSSSESGVKLVTKEATTSQIPVMARTRDSKQSLKAVKSGTSIKSNDSIDDESSQTKDGRGEASNDVVDENDSDPLLWQTVRASGAAPFFFKPYGPFLDGGIISNNPTLDMLTEFYNLEGTKRFLRDKMQNDKGFSKGKAMVEPPTQLELVVSLGTGRGRIIGKQTMVDFGAVASGILTVFSPVELVKSIRAARDLFRKLMQQSCHTEDHIVDRAQAWCSSIFVPYFRINPPLTTLFPIDDKRDEQLINALWQAKLYMHTKRAQLQELADLLDG